MLGGFLRTGIAAVMVFSTLSCAALGINPYSPEFDKPYTGPTAAEIKAMEEQAAAAEKRQQAYDNLNDALSQENLKRGKDMDFSKIDKAAELAPNDVTIAANRYVMLVLAGKTAELPKATKRAEEIYTAEKDAAAAPHAIYATAWELQREKHRFPADSAEAKALQTAICDQANASRAKYPPGTPWSMHKDDKLEFLAGCP